MSHYGIDKSRAFFSIDEDFDSIFTMQHFLFSFPGKSVDGQHRMRSQKVYDIGPPKHYFFLGNFKIARAPPLASPVRLCSPRDTELRLNIHGTHKIFFPLHKHPLTFCAASDFATHMPNNKKAVTGYITAFNFYLICSLITHRSSCEIIR
jgi:hypothetical protein